MLASGLVVVDERVDEQERGLVDRPLAGERDVGEVLVGVVGQGTFEANFEGEPERVVERPADVAAFARQGVSFGVGEVLATRQRVLHEPSAQRCAAAGGLRRPRRAPRLRGAR